MTETIVSPVDHVRALAKEMAADRNDAQLRTIQNVKKVLDAAGIEDTETDIQRSVMTGKYKKVADNLFNFCVEAGVFNTPRAGAVKVEDSEETA